MTIVFIVGILACAAFFVGLVWMLIQMWLADRRRPAERARAEAAFRAELEETKRIFWEAERRRRSS